jgi:hypothetical protein
MSVDKMSIADGTADLAQWWYMKTLLADKPRRRRVRALRPHIFKKVAAPSLWELMKPFVGMADNLPADLAANHDHYLYGASKRSPR